VLEAQLNAVMMRMARQVTVITDATKLGRRSLSIIGDMGSIHRVITDDRVTDDMACQLRALGIEVLIV